MHTIARDTKRTYIGLKQIHISGTVALSFLGMTKLDKIEVKWGLVKGSWSRAQGSRVGDAPLKGRVKG